MKVVISRMYGYEVPYEVIMEYSNLSGIKINAFWDDFENNSEIEVKDPKEHDGELFINYRLENGDMFFGESIARTDPFLIKSVEKYNQERYYPGLFLRLKIIEIPDDVDWKIAYDSEWGNEWIEEKHRTWR
jgi:hypothetical protein